MRKARWTARAIAKTRRKATSTLGLVIACWAVSSTLSAEDPPSPPEVASNEQIIEQILALRERLEALLEALPPELREEVERRWRQRQGAAPTPPEDTRRPAEPPAAPTAPPRSEPPPEAAAPAVPPTASARRATPPPACATLRPLDSNGDEVISAGDRYWRLLRLWFDNGDSEVDESELETLYELGIREVGVRLRYYKLVDGASGDISTAAAVRLELFGKGGAPARSGVAVIDAGRLSRAGEVWLVDAAGTTLSGYQPLREGVAFALADGSRQPLACP